MKIHSVNVAPVTVQPLTASPQEEANVAPLAKMAMDNYSPTQSRQMLDNLNSQPDVRPEVLEKAKQMASDPNYPSADVLESVANLFVSESD